MCEILVATQRKSEVFGDDSSPFFNHFSWRILVKGAVDFYEVEYFAVGLQRGFVGDVKVCPSACPDQIINQQIPRKHLEGLIIRMFKVRGKIEMGLVLVACAIGKLYLAVNRFLV